MTQTITLRFARNEAEKFLSAIWLYPSADPWYELRVIGKRTRTIWCKKYSECLDTLEKIWKRIDHDNITSISVGILPRESFDEEELGENGVPRVGGRKKHVDRGMWLWADYDCKKEVSLDELGSEIREALERDGYCIIKNHGGALEAYVKINDKVYYINKPGYNEILERVKDLREKGLIINIVVDSGFGYHFYSKLRYDIDAPRLERLEKMYSRLVGNDPQVSDLARIMRLPGTWNTKFPQLVRPVKIVYLDMKNENDPEEIEEKLRLMLGQGEKPTEVIAAHKRKLSDSEIRRIVELLKPYWIRGHRQKIELRLSGMLWMRGVDRESFRKIIDIITVVTNDEEREKRLRDVDYLWDRMENGNVEKIAGKNKLIEEIENVIKEKNPAISTDQDTSQDARDEAIRVVDEIERILKLYFKDILVRIPYETRSWFVNDPRRGIILLKERETKEGEIVRSRKYISTWYIAGIKVVKTGSTFYYRLTLRNVRTKEKLIVSGTLDEIVKKIMNIHGVERSKHLRDAISSLITEFIHRRIAKVIKTSEACGIFYDKKKDQLKLVKNGVISKLLIPRENNIEKARKALELLIKIREFYDTRKFDIAINWTAYSILSYVLKKHYNIKQYYLFLYGERQTGKTTLARIISQLFPVRTEDEDSLEEGLTEYRLSYIMNLTTFPMLVDEAEGISTKPRLLALLKRASTSIIARWRGDTSHKYRARAALMFTSNQPEMFIDPALIERLIILDFDYNDYIYKKPRKELEEFKKTYHEYLSVAPWLGRIIIETVIEKWKDIRDNYAFRLHEKADAIDMGRYIWSLVTEKLGIEAPWTKTLVTTDEIDKDYNEKEHRLVFELIEDIVRDTLLRLREPLRGRTLAETIVELYTRGYLPSYIKVKDNILVVTGTIIHELQRRYNIKPIGGLEKMARRLGYEYKSYRIVKGAKPIKGMGIPLSEFNYRLSFDEDIGENSTGNGLDKSDQELLGKALSHVENDFNILGPHEQDLMNEIISRIEKRLEQGEKPVITRELVEEIMSKDLGMDREEIEKTIDKIYPAISEYYSIAS